MQQLYLYGTGSNRCTVPVHNRQKTTAATVKRRRTTTTTIITTTKITILATTRLIITKCSSYLRAGILQSESRSHTLSIHLPRIGSKEGEEVKKKKEREKKKGELEASKLRAKIKSVRISFLNFLSVPNTWRSHRSTNKLKNF